MSNRPHVVVVGAGLSGLTCARRLSQAGATVQVVEARARVGGRAFTGVVAGAQVDLGAQWITPGQSRIIELARELDVELVRDARSGSVVIGHDPGQRGSLLSRLPLLSTIELPRRLGDLEAMSRALTPEAVDFGEDALAWDRLSLGDWLASNTRGDRTRSALRLLAELNFAAPPRDISLLHFVWSIAATGSLAGGELRGAGELRVVGGAQHLCQRMAHGLGRPVLLETPVRSIETAATGVRVVHARGTVEADAAVVAVPPPLQRTIEYTPPDPTARPAVTMAGVIKCALTYDRAFWIEDRRVGEAYGVHGRVRAVVDGTRTGGPPLLLAFVVGDAARELSRLSRDERQQLVTGELAQLLGASAAHPASYVDKDWLADPWSLGCELSLAPGQAAAYLSTARTPHGRIHFAGTETATRWPRYLEGAVHAGERAAHDVLAALE